MANENEFQPRLIKDLYKTFNGCIITKLDAGYTEGIPDLLILYKNKWATLECKRDISEVTKPRKNKRQQDYYVSTMKEMSYSSYIYPQNKEEVINELKVYFQST